MSMLRKQKFLIVFLDIQRKVAASYNGKIVCICHWTENVYHFFTFVTTLPESYGIHAYFIAIQRKVDVFTDFVKVVIQFSIIKISILHEVILAFIYTKKIEKHYKSG